MLLFVVPYWKLYWSRNPPPPLRLPRYYIHFILATWQNGSCSSSTAIHFLVKRKNLVETVTG